MKIFFDEIEFDKPLSKLTTFSLIANLSNKLNQFKTELKNRDPIERFRISWKIKIEVFDG